MRQVFAALMISGLAVSTGYVSSAESQRDTGGTHERQGYGGQEVLRYEDASNVEILVNGLPQPRYAHRARWYVEALKGREYAIRLRNPYPVRVAVALSVDGLNTIDAQRTTAAQARKWVLAPYETITLSGWQVSSTHARKFEFTTEQKSYAQALGKADNLGVISAVFFRERVRTSSTKVEPYRARERDRGRERGADQAERVRRSSEEGADASTAPQSPAPLLPPAPSLAGESMSEGVQTQKHQEYAATGMGDRTGHAVTFINMDLETAPAQTVNIRYEYRDQLVRLGVLPGPITLDPLTRRDGSRGFEAGFSPEIPTR